MVTLCSSSVQIRSASRLNDLAITAGLPTPYNKTYLLTVFVSSFTPASAPIVRHCVSNHDNHGNLHVPILKEFIVATINRLTDYACNTLRVYVCRHADD